MDGDVYCGTSNVGLSARIDGLRAVDDALVGVDAALAARVDAAERHRGRNEGLSTPDCRAEIDALNATDAMFLQADAQIMQLVQSLNATDRSSEVKMLKSCSSCSR